MLKLFTRHSNKASYFYMVLILQIFLSFSANSQTTLTALSNDNDAYIDLNWTLEKDACLTNNGIPYSDGIFIQLLANGQEIFSETILNVNEIGATYSNSFRHRVGPNKNFNYELIVFERGPARPLCNETTTGSTTAFQPPTIVSVSQAESPDSIIVRWLNNSKLSTNFLVFRDQQLIANLPGTDEIGKELVYRDGYTFNQSNSIRNGITYTYSIGTFSDLATGLDQVAQSGSTLPIQFTATDGTPDDAVDMQWNDLTAFGDRIQILRNGVIIKMLSSDVTNYRDASPVHGLNSTYSLILIRNDAAVVQVDDPGSVPRNGIIGGKVVTENELFPIKNATVKINAIAGDSTVMATTTTDFAGCFTFPPQFYNREATFTITVSKSGKTFKENPRQLTLNSANPAITDLIILQKESITQSGTVNVTNFTATPTANQDQVVLDWSYSQVANQTTQFNIYRGSSLIGRVDDANGQVTTFTDKNGAPNTTFNYRLVAFRIDAAGNNVATTSVFAEATYPDVAPAVNFNATARPANGDVLLSWGPNHTSTNYSGFRLYRSLQNNTMGSERIAELPTDVFTYTDLQGEPNRNYFYFIRAFREVEGIDFESAAVPVPLTATPYPDLSAPTAFSLQTVVNGIQLEWNVPTGLTESYNFGGFYIYRQAAGETDFTRIGEVGRGAIPAPGQTINSFIDYTGVPAVTYTYKVTTYLQTEQSLYENATPSEMLLFPVVTAPTNLVASPASGKVNLTWDNYPGTFRNINGFILYRNNDSLATIAPGVTKFTDYVNNPPFVDPINYTLKAYRDVNSQRYYSTEIADNAVLADDSDDFPVLPTNVTASTDIPNHIKICWDYPVFALSEFVVYRSGVPISGVLSTETRAYYDYDAPKFDAVEYSVQAVFEGDNSPQVYTVGRLKYFRTLSGRVLKNESGQGVPNVQISVEASFGSVPGSLSYSVQTQTDSAGYYQVHDLPCLRGTLVVTATHVNSDFVDDPAVDNTITKLVTITTDQDDYVLNFTDYYLPPYNTTEIAQLSSVTAIPDPAKMGVSISWSPTSPNYTGFEIRRGTAVIAEIMKGEALTFLDAKGTPGISYAYTVRAFWDTPTGRLFSNPLSGGTTYPVFSPPINLTATPVPFLNSIRLQWSHLYNDHDGYLIKRNDSEFARTLTIDALKFDDVGGEPGKVYNYSVQAIKGDLLSEPATIQITYPNPIDPTNFLTSAANAINHLILSWDYPANAADGFEIYRNDVPIAELDGAARIYRDTFGIPDQTLNQYRIEAFIIRNNVRYNSRKEVIRNNLFPNLTPPINLSINVNPATAVVEFRWKYPERGADGFLVYRNGVQVENRISSEFGDAAFIYEDMNASPGEDYTYAVEAYTQRNGSLFKSLLVSLTQTIGQPSLPRPTNFTASQGIYFDRIELNWDYDQSVEVDGFEIDRLVSGNPVASYELSGGRRTFTEVVASGTHDYSIRAFLDINGQKYYSDYNTTFGSTKVLNPGGQETGNGQALVGRSVAMHGKWMAVNNGVVVDIYERTAKGYKFRKNLHHPYEVLDIDMSDRWLIVGNGNAQGQGGCVIYEVDNGDFTYNSQVYQNTNVINLGHRVAIDGNLGVVCGYEWVLPLTFDGATWEAPPAPRFLIDDFSAFRISNVAIEDNTMALCEHYKLNNYNAPSNTSFFERRLRVLQWVNNNSFETREYYGYKADVPGNFTPTELNGFDVDMANDRILISSAAPNFYNRIDDHINGAETIQARVYEYDPGTGSIPDPTKANSGYNITNGDPSFGGRASLSGDYAAISIPSYGNAPGKVNIYQLGESNATFIRTIGDPDGTAVSLFGYGVDLAGNFMGVGAFCYKTVSGSGNPKNGKVYNFQISPYLTNVTATQDLSTGVRISWTVPSNVLPGGISGFKVYRDDKTTAIASPASGNTFYEDASGIPGKYYTYSVTAVDSETGVETQCLSAIGYRLPNGLISGNVQTERGSAAVSGVTIVAKASIDGEFYRYEDITDNAGRFTLDEVYIGSGTAQYTITATKPNSTLKPFNNTDQVNLTTNQPSNNSVVFLETTSSTVEGVITFKDTDCPIAGVKVYAIKTNTNGDETREETLTNSRGFYSLVIDPQDLTTNNIQIEVDPLKIIGADQPDPDTIYYQFATNAVSDFDRAALDNLDRITEVDFTEQTQYPIDLKVQDTCLDPIATDAQWEIRIRTADACFDKMVLTNNIGETTINLPPLDYNMRITKVSNQNAANLLALDYLKGRNLELNLAQLHADSVQVVTTARFNQLTQRNFTYHKAPTITLTNGIVRYMCDDPANAAVLQQDDNYTLTFSVTENHKGQDCAVKEGYLKISNPADANSGVPVILNYDPVLERFPDYTFTAGDPNIIAPFLHLLQVEYFTPSNDFLKALKKAVFVEGLAAVPGSDIIVNPETDGDQVQLPLFVLRDPPGDGSFSSIAEGETVAKRISIEQTEGGSATLATKQNLSILGLGSSIEVSVTNGGGGTQSREYSYEVTTSTEISTSADQSKNGRAADIVVGAGLAMQYGLMQELRLGECNEVISTTRLGFSPNKINTTWVYTIQQLEDIVAGYQNDLVRVQTGNLTYSDGGVILTKEAAIERINSYIKNWQGVLQYHNVETLPHYTLCSREAKYQKLNPAYRERIYEWQDEFCNQIGSYDGNKFIINDPSEIVWDNQLVDLYNSAETAIRHLSEAIPEPNALLVWDYNENTPRSQYADQQFDGQFGIAAENYTFGGGTTINKSFSAARTSTKLLNSFFDFTASGGLTVGVQQKFRVSTGFGFETITTLAEVESTATASGEITFNISEDREVAQTKTVDINYTLADDDIGDQFSVTVIQGPAQNHTPYFSLLGGRSSCPPEPETIVRDDVRLQIIDPETGAATQEASQYNIDPEGNATFLLKVTNNSPFNEARDFLIYLNPNTNTGGAFVRLGGNVLGSQEYYGIQAGADGAFILPLTVERGFFSFNHSLTVSIQALCQDGILDAQATTSTIKVNTFFRNPCTPITISAPDNHWVLNNTNSELVVAIRDYNPANPPLQEVRLQYRQLGAGQGWANIPLRHLSDLDEFVTPQVLQANNDMIAATQIPQYRFFWQLPNDDFITYPDGNYEIRVVADCGSSETVSNVISGSIRRSGLRLLGTPEPADGLWTPGDEISFSFNSNLNCSLLDDPTFVADNIKMTNVATGADVAFSVECFNNQLFFTTVEEMSVYDGESLEICLSNIQANAGNSLPDPVSWQFDVITQQLYWSEDTIKVELYAGETLNMTTLLANSTANSVDNISLKIKDGTLEGNWLTYQPSGTFSVNPGGRNVDLTISSETLQTFSEVIEVVGLVGRVPELYIEATFKKRSPNWEVDDSDPDAPRMNIVANWRFTDEATSKDLLDRVAVFMDGELRGVANITQAGEQFYAAYLTVLGNEGDNGKRLEFRVWNADEGQLYLAEPDRDILFTDNGNEGSTNNPVLLNVDRTNGLIRGIPLNQGWTWFSANVIPNAISINQILGGLNNPAEGDVVKTADGAVQYSEETGWYNPGVNGLNNLNPNKGYMIYLANQADTLYLAGTPATPQTIPLREGWNWVGYPLQNEQLLNGTLQISPVTNGDVIKTRWQDEFEISRTAVYNGTAGNWQGSLDELRPYDAFKINVNNAGGSNLSFNGNPLQDNSTNMKSGQPIANPQDETTWVVPELPYEYIMYMVAEVESNGNITDDLNDKLAVFVGNDLRGVGSVNFIPALNRYEFTLLVGTNNTNENFSFYFYDASIDQIFNINEQLTFRERGYGTYNNPYLFDANLFTVDVVKQNTACSQDESGSIQLMPQGGTEPYTYDWGDGYTAASRTGLGAGTYTISVTDINDLPVVVTVVIVNENTELTIPTIQSSDADNRLCAGGSLTLTASAAGYPNAEFYWYNENGNLLFQGQQFVLSNQQSNRAIHTRTNDNGCFSNEAITMIEVENLVSAEFTVSDRTPIAGEQPITFTPIALEAGVKYTWDFGDGNSSIERIPTHTYQTEGKFNVVLTTLKDNRCSNTFFRNQYIITDRSQTICESPLDSDGDGVQDDCDNCPYYSNFSQLDDNDNGKGNPCDCNFYATDQQTLNIGGTLEQKRYVASQNIISNGKGVSGYTEFYAGNSITLQAGFTIESGATFLATIATEDLGNCQPLTDDGVALRQTSEDVEVVTPTVGSLLVYPNPFKGNTQIVYQLEKAGEVDLGLYDLNGARVKTLQPQQWQNSGRISIELNSGQLPQGIYYVRLRTGQEILTQKVMLLE